MPPSNIVRVPSQGQAKDNDDVAVDSTVGGVLILSANPNRRSALIINTGPQPMRVTTDGSAPTTTHGKLITQGAALSLDGSDCPTAAIKAISQSGTPTSANGSEVS